MYILKEVGTQVRQNLLLGGQEVFFNKFEEIPFAEFAKNSTAKDSAFSDKPLEDMEDTFWDSGINDLRKYAVNVDLSLFSDNVDIWNLNKFTNVESNIHATPYYRSVRTH